MEFKPYKMGKYLLLERLAAGGMAEVYRAKSSGASGFEKHLAIKRILPEHLEDETFRKMFETEARIGSSLQHANIVPIFDFVKFGETFLLVMEFINGKNLRQLVNKLKKQDFTLPIECALFIINETSKGLEYAHSKKDEYSGQPYNIIHRDMSPQNIMISYDGSVKIVDFGIANCKDKIEHTKSGVIKGKFGYMSPEQAAGEVLTPLSDLFSLGIIFWELLTGKRLFSAESDLATLRLIQDCLIPKPSQFNPKINPELEKLVMKALSKSPQQRFKNAGAMQKQLQEFLNKHYPGFRGTELGSMMQAVFEDEMTSEKRRLEQLSRQSVPFSQGGEASLEIQEEASFKPWEGQSITESDQEKISHITFVDKESLVSDVIQVTDPETPTQQAGLITNTLSDTEPGEAAHPPSPSLSNTEKTLVALQNTEKPIEKPSALEKALKNASVASTLKKTEQELSFSKSLGRGAHDDILIEKSVSLKKNSPSETQSEIQNPLEIAHPVQWSVVLKMASAFCLLGVTLYLYQALLSGKSTFVDQIAQISQKEVPVTVNPIDSRPTSSVNQSLNSLPVPTNCELKFETDPPGALLIIDGIEKLSTPGTALIPCNSSVNYSLQMPGFEPLSENILVKPGLKPLFKTLKKMEIGNVIIIVNRRVKVLSDVTLIGETEPGKPFLIEGVPSRQPLALRLVNDIFGIDSRVSLEVKPNINSTYQIDLNDPK